MAIKDLREVSRSAIRARVAEVAEEMFLADGFESTTVDAIAAAVGMSQRTFFRYFPSKDDLVLHNFEQLGENLSERLTRRPPEESDWVALRHSFDVVAEQFSDPHRRARGLMIQQIIDNSTALLPGYLEKIARIQHRLAAVLQARRLATAPDTHVDDALLHALIGAAFACLQAVVSEAANSTEGTDFVARLDSIMSAIHPEPGR